MAGAGAKMGRRTKLTQTPDNAIHNHTCSQDIHNTALLYRCSTGLTGITLLCRYVGRIPTHEPAVKETRPIAIFFLPLFFSLFRVVFAARPASAVSLLPESIAPVFLAHFGSLEMIGKCKQRKFAPRLGDDVGEFVN